MAGEFGEERVRKGETERAEGKSDHERERERRYRRITSCVLIGLL